MNSIELVQWINTLIRNNNIKAFYNSALWEHIRVEVLEEQHHECQLCKVKGLYVPANTVHHIKFLRKYPQLALTKSNLLVVCKDCHYNIHHKIVPSLKPQLNIERW
ncbi:HNH endonuclease [Clostridium sp. 001]|uniref:HNH endonuclease n=1 Tax=Clostridium sp. 001 TaxID=1970093 RepID=UPI001C2BA535|nr:HNH endonuclease [Clostridium sp. 001]QXE19993.1 HNH endonuclease [Clostridium sp. 001]